MQRLLISAILFGFMATVNFGATPKPVAQSPQSPEGPVWYWFEDCPPAKSLGLEVKRHGILLFRSSFPICQMPRTDHEQKTLVFTFKAGKAYHALHISPAETVEGDIWLASADSDALVLGVSFSTRKRILLNTLYVAKPDRKSASEIERGFVVRTFPLPSE